jgi:hypothetical protein
MSDKDHPGALARAHRAAQDIAQQRLANHTRSGADAPSQDGRTSRQPDAPLTPSLVSTPDGDAEIGGSRCCRCLSTNERKLATKPSIGHRSLASRSAFIDFDAVNQVALVALPNLLARWLPGGTRCGSEYLALNPRRADRHLGSFSINLRSGRWSDFATKDRGGDVIGLRAFLCGTDRLTAAAELAAELGLGRRDR